jgi:NADH-quinone oxidoreductase subunit G
MSKQVTLTIDGQQVTVPEGTLIVNAAKKIGVDIPVFCYHPKMEPVGMCRMCLVEIGRPVIDRATGQPVLEEDGSPKIQFGPKLDTACTNPVSEGMVVRGMTDKVKAGRKDILEFLLTSHPLDCPICDKGGECPLQNLTMGYGPGQSRFLYDEKIHLDKHVPLGELIYLDRERCIQCARCVRFQDEIADDPVIGFYERGRSLEIVTFSEPGFDSYFSGNTTDICPVGALTTADFRFGARPWELNAAASICTQCPVGCNLTFNVRREAKANGNWVIKRVMPRQNEQVNEIWICDKGRFTYHYTESPERLTQPLIRKGSDLVPSSWEEALKVVAQRFKEAGDGLLTLASGRLSNEDLFNLHELTSRVGGESFLYSHMAGGDLVAQVGVGKGTNFSEMGAGTAILVVASDLLEEAPIWWLRVKQAAERGATLMVANSRPTKLERYSKYSIRYPYGAEAAAVLAMVNALSAKRPNLPESVQNLLHSPGLQTAAKAFAQAENAVILFGSDCTGLEASQALVQACANLLITTGHVGKPNNGLIGVWSRANDQGAWDMGFRPLSGLKEAMASARALYIVAADPAGDDPTLAETGAFLVVQEMFLTATAKLADVVLPAQAFTEREGSLTSGERRVQRYYPAMPERPESKADFTIAALIGKLLNVDLEGGAASLVMGRIAASVPAYKDLSYLKLAQVAEQWPVFGRADLYYGGTGYENSQGLGVQLSSAAERGEPVSLTWPQLIPFPVPEGGVLAVPVTRLYDRGQTVLPSHLLRQRIPQPYIVLHPDEAARLKLDGSDTAELSLNGTFTFVTLQLDENLPAGIVLVPRSLGIPISGPTAATLRPVEKVIA